MPKPFWHVRREIPEDDPNPLPLGVKSNGEYFFVPTVQEQTLEKRARLVAETESRRRGTTRRRFLQTSGGIAATLSAANQLGCGGDPYPSCEEDAEELLSRDDLVFDMQTHHVQLDTNWRDTNQAYRIFYEDLLPSNLESCEDGAACFLYDDYMKLIFEESDTSMACMSGLPGLSCEESEVGEMCGLPIDNRQMSLYRDKASAAIGQLRVFSHAMVMPNEGIDRALKQMSADAAQLKPVAWKCYTPWGQIPADVVASLEGKPESELILMAINGELKGTGFALDDPEVGLPFIERGIELGVRVFCCHKGLPLPTFDPAFTGTDDLVHVASQYADARFVVYHSGYNAGASSFVERIVEGPFGTPDADPALATKGINNLLTALDKYGMPRSGNVYAELGGVWSSVFADPVESQHVIGKLMKRLGSKRILWGTDAVWVGSPQPLIEAFRLFTISEEFQSKYGYPPLTDDDKANILGRNAIELLGISADQCSAASTQAQAQRRALRERREAGDFQAATPRGPRTISEYVRRWWLQRDHP
jgi:uncharacterized protein